MLFKWTVKKTKKQFLYLFVFIATILHFSAIKSMSDTDFNSFNEEFAGLEKEISSYGNQTASMQQEVTDLLSKISTQKKEGFFSGLNNSISKFRSQTLIQTPQIHIDDNDWDVCLGSKEKCEQELGYSSLPGFRLGLYGSDILNLGLTTAGMGIDYLLYKKLQEYSSKKISNAILTKHKTILEHIKTIEKAISDKNRKQQRIARRQFNSFLKKECLAAPSLKQIFMSPIIVRILINIILGESLNYIKNKTSEPKFQFSLDSAMALSEKFESNSKNGFPISPTSMVINLFQSYSFSSPFSFLGSFGFRNKTFDSYGFYIAKRFLILTRFIKQLSTRYSNLMIKHLTRNMSEFAKLLERYKSLKENNEEPYKARINKIHEKLDHISKKINFLDKNGHKYAFSLKLLEEKNQNPVEINDEFDKTKISKKLTSSENDIYKFVENGHKTSFLRWMRFKCVSCTKTNLLIETVISIPALLKAGKFALGSLF